MDTAEPDEQRSTTQRVTFGGVAATLSTVSAVLVALASMFTAVQAMQISRASAQQKLFEEQLNACTALNDLRAAVNKNNNDVMVWFEDQGPEFDAAEKTELRRLLVINDDHAAMLERQYAQTSMLLPRKDVYDSVYEAMDQHIVHNHLGWDALEAGSVSAATAKKTEAAMEREDDHLLRAFTGCSRYIRGVVNGDRIIN